MTAHPLPPGATIGILGGGQLARMLSSAATKLGFTIAILDPDEHCPARSLCRYFIHANYDDAQALSRLAELCPVITYEFENVPMGATHQLSETGTAIFPPPKALAIAQDRLLEKQFLHGLGLPTTRFFDITDQQSLEQAMTTLNGPAILKTRQFGYDGKGQVRLNSPEDSAKAWSEIGTTPSLLEARVNFAFELSVIAVRDSLGQIATYQPAQNIHEDGILRRSIVPCPAHPSLINEARTMARTLIQALDYVGVLGLELFAIKDNGADTSRLKVNEFAPRVHNSGHWTQEACAHSQFENHIRAVVGWPLTSTKRHANCVMDNIIGNEIENWQSLAAEEGALLTLYGKKHTRPGRKMGHVTRLSPNSP